MDGDDPHWSSPIGVQPPLASLSQSVHWLVRAIAGIGWRSGLLPPGLDERGEPTRDVTSGARIYGGWQLIRLRANLLRVKVSAGQQGVDELNVLRASCGELGNGEIVRVEAQHWGLEPIGCR